ncbi:MAG: hypothetical protein GEV10_01705 [Streptosporangiales bacterium]|nr:hypothetical protein [Streptosporangiales bacterium]
MNTTAGVDANRYRSVLSHYPTGVSVITAVQPNGTPAGMLVGTFTSVSLDPPLVAFLPDKASTSWPLIRAAGSFCANILGSEQEALCQQFAYKGGDKFANVSWQPAASGSPVIDGVVAWVDCDIEQVFESGDHYIVIGRVRDLDVSRPGTPLAFVRGSYGEVALRAELSQGPARRTAELLGAPEDDIRRWFTSKERIVDELLTDYLQDLMETYRDVVRESGTPRAVMASLIRASFASIDNHRGAVIVFQNERTHLTEARFAHIAAIERQMQDLWTDVISHGIETGDFRGDVEPRMVYRFIRDATFMAVRWYRPEGRLTSAELADQYARLMIDGFGTHRTADDRTSS